MHQDWLLPANAESSVVANAYNEFGFVALWRMLTPSDVADLDAAYREGLSYGTIHPSLDEIADNYDTIFRHPTFERYVRDPRILGHVRAIIGKGIELQHVKFNAKPVSGGGEQPWHQDFPFFPHTNYDLLAVTLYLDDVDENNGALRFLPGSHKGGELTHCDETGQFVYACADQTACSNHPYVLLEVPAGTVTIHHCFAVHSSGQVRDHRERRLLIFQYRADDAVQLAGVIWDSTGLEIARENPIRRARFPDGTTINLRGRSGRLVDVFGNLKPATPLPSVRSLRLDKKNRPDRS